MSRKKYTKAEKKLMIKRAVEVFGLKTQKELADIFKESPQSFSNKIRTGSALDIIETEAYKRNLDFNYILTGEHSPRDHGVNEQPPPYRNGLARHTDLIRKTLDILDSGTYYASALASIIVDFHNAVKGNDTLADRVDALDKKCDDFFRIVSEMREDLSDLRLPPERAKKKTNAE
jgi:hypothetical protein